MKGDLELLDAWQAGDTDSGNQLFDRHFRSLYRFFATKVAEGVEDLVQQTFLACLEGRDRIRNSKNFRSYMFGCARFIFIRECERLTKARAVECGVSSVHDLSPGLSTDFARRAQERLLLEALRRIPIDYQIALELYHFEGMKGPELAEALGIPEATIRSRLRRGLGLLRKHMAEIADSEAQLESTMRNLADWARAIRDQISVT